MLIHGTSKIVYGTLAMVSADSLGSLALGGFKENCSALRMCRHCMSTRGESQKQVLIYNCLVVSTICFYLVSGKIF